MEVLGGMAGWCRWQRSGNIQQGTELLAQGIGAVHAHINAATGANLACLTAWVACSATAITNLEIDCFCDLRSEVARIFSTFGCHGASDCETFFAEGAEWAAFRGWASSSKDGKCRCAQIT